MIQESSLRELKSLTTNKEYKDALSELLQKPAVQFILVLLVLALLLYVSRCLLNWTAHSIHAFKNLQAAIAR